MDASQQYIHEQHDINRFFDPQRNASPSPLRFIPPPHLQSSARSTPSATPPPAAAVSSRWEDEFQAALHIHDAQQQNAPPQWANEFNQEFIQRQPLPQVDYAYQPAPPYLNYPQEHQPTAPNQDFNEEAFERAFHEAEQMGEEEEQREQEVRVDDDALARTASSLLAALDHEKSEKFAKSNFLELMRKLRDHEVVVEGNRMVESVDVVVESNNSSSSSSSTVRRSVDPVYHGYYSEGIHMN